PVVRLPSLNLFVLPLQLRSSLAEFAVAAGQAPVLAAGLVAFALRRLIPFAFALALALAQAVALLLQQVDEFLPFALLAGLARELLAPFGKLLAVLVAHARGHFAQRFAERILALVL